MIEGTQAERLFLAEQRFILFAIYYFSDYFKYKLADYHKDFAQDLHDLLDNKIREAIWVAFRESAKTTFAKLFIIYCICYNKKRYINVDSFDKENAERILFDVAYELVNNKRLIADFGEMFSKQRSINEIKQNRINNFVTENGVRVEAHSTQESVRGRLHLNQRPDLLIADDIETNKTKDSLAYTKQVKDHFTEAQAGMSPEGVILVLGNYISEYGNIHWFMERAKEDPKMRVRNIPVVIGDKPAWEAKYCMTDAEAVETGKVSLEDKRRQLGHYVFSYEMMNQPIDEASAEFKKEWIQRATDDEISHLSFNTFIAVDPAISEKESADFTGVAINRVSSEGKRYLTAYRIKLNPTGLIDHLFYLYTTYKPTIIGIEESAFILAIKPFIDEEMRKRNQFFSIVPLKHGGTKKETRIRGLIPLFESKSVFLLGDTTHLEHEMRSFPLGQHDDILDALAYSEQIAYKPHDTSNLERLLDEEPLYPEIGL